MARRFALAAAASATLALGAAHAAPAPAPAPEQDMSMGSPTAPVTVIEYASPTCPHCAHFNAEVFPAFKAKYVDTGKVRYVLRETPIHPQLDFPVFMLARCADRAKYFGVIDGVMKAQSEYLKPGLSNEAFGEAFKKSLYQVAGSAGLDEKTATACMESEAGFNAVRDRVVRETKAYDIHSTPTFIVDGVKLDPEKPVDLAALDAAIGPELAKKAHQTKPTRAKRRPS
jgi:protein-disulfide isomerase